MSHRAFRANTAWFIAGVFSCFLATTGFDLVRPARKIDGPSSAREIAEALDQRRGDISQLALPYLQYVDGQMTSGLAKLSEVADIRRVNIAFLDYQCPFCRADHARLMALVRAHPGQRYFICQTAILGPDSIAAANAAIRSVLSGNFVERHDDLMAGRTDLFEESRTPRPADSDPDASRSDSVIADAMLHDHERLMSLLNVRATPTYIIEGAVVLGTIRQIVDTVGANGTT